MKKIWIAGLGAVLVAGMVVAGPLKGHPNLKKAHNKIKEAQALITKAQAANEFDMEGHAAKAKDLLDQAEQEIAQAAEAASANKK